jgi:DNA-binding GntR family transcriptional regulator
MPPGGNDSRAPYVQLAEVLRAQILAGRFAPGQQLPSGKDLAAEHGLAINTVASAIRVLRDEGLVVSQQGKGTFVRDQLVPRDEMSPEAALIMDRLDGLTEEIRGLAERLDVLEKRADS